MGNEATYNIDTKAISAENMRTGNYPYLMTGQTVNSTSDEEYIVEHGTFTTHDSSKPDFRLKPRSVRIYPDDRVDLQERHFLRRGKCRFSGGPISTNRSNDPSVT